MGYDPWFRGKTHDQVLLKRLLEQAGLTELVLLKLLD